MFLVLKSRVDDVVQTKLLGSVSVTEITMILDSKELKCASWVLSSSEPSKTCFLIVFQKPVLPVNFPNTDDQKLFDKLSGCFQCCTLPQLEWKFDFSTDDKFRDKYGFSSNKHGTPPDLNFLNGTGRSFLVFLLLTRFL